MSVEIKSRRRGVLPAHMASKPLSTNEALQRMQTGSRLVHMHGKPDGRHWFVVPGGAVTDAVADAIKNHPSIIGQRDGLFPGLDQTWRMQSFVT
jgi:hypothetical protein